MNLIFADAQTESEIQQDSIFPARYRLLWHGCLSVFCFVLLSFFKNKSYGFLQIVTTIKHDHKNKLLII